MKMNLLLLALVAAVPALVHPPVAAVDSDPSPPSSGDYADGR